MSGYQINPPIYTGECATCGRVQEDAICEDCTAFMEAQNTAILDFYAALPADLQAAFDPADSIFDGGYQIKKVSKSRQGIKWTAQQVYTNETVSPAYFYCTASLIEWCIQNREVLI